MSCQRIIIFLIISAGAGNYKLAGELQDQMKQLTQAVTVPDHRDEVSQQQEEIEKKRMQLQNEIDEAAKAGKYKVAAELQDQLKQLAVERAAPVMERHQQEKNEKRMKLQEQKKTFESISYSRWLDPVCLLLAEPVCLHPVQCPDPIC